MVGLLIIFEIVTSLPGYFFFDQVHCIMSLGVNSSFENRSSHALKRNTIHFVSLTLKKLSIILEGGLGLQNALVNKCACKEKKESDYVLNHK